MIGYRWTKKIFNFSSTGGLVKPSPKSTVAPGESRRPISIPNRSNDSISSPSVSAKSLSIQSDSPQRKRSIPPAASTVKKSESPTGMYDNFRLNGDSSHKLFVFSLYSVITLAVFKEFKLQFSRKEQ